MNKLKDTNKKLTEKLSNHLTVLRADLKTALKTAFTKINKFGKEIDNLENTLRDKLKDLTFYQLNNFSKSKNSKTLEEKTELISFSGLMSTLYELSNNAKKEDKQKLRGTYFHRSLEIVAKTVVLLCDAKLNEEIKIKIIDKSDIKTDTDLIVNNISLDSQNKNRTMKTVALGELAVEYNYLKPSFKELNKTLSSKENPIYDTIDNTDDCLIPLNKEGVMKLYKQLHSVSRDGEETNTPNPEENNKSFIGVVTEFSNYILEKAGDKNFLADYNINDMMLGSIQNLERNILAFNQCSKKLLSEDNPSKEKLVGTTKLKELKKTMEGK
jgi:hypothetical protein